MTTILGNTDLYAGETYTFTTSDSSIGNWSFTNILLTLVSGGTASDSVTYIVDNVLLSDIPITINFVGGSNASKNVTLKPLPLSVTVGSLIPLISGEQATLIVDTVLAPVAGAGTWTLNNGICTFIGPSTLVSTATVKAGIFSSSVIVTYTSPAGAIGTFSFNVNLISIVYTGMTLPIISGELGNISIDNTGLSFIDGTWTSSSNVTSSRYRFEDTGNPGTYDQNIVTGLSPNFKARFHSGSNTNTSNAIFEFISDSGGRGVLTITMKGIPVTSVFPFTPMVSGEIFSLTASPTSAGTTLSYTSLVWQSRPDSFYEDTGNPGTYDQTTSTNITTNVKNVSSIDASHVYSFVADNEGEGYFAFFAEAIPTTITLSTNPLVSGDIGTLEAFAVSNGNALSYVTGTWSSFSSPLVRFEDSPGSGTYNTINPPAGLTINFINAEPDINNSVRLFFNADNGGKAFIQGIQSVPIPISGTINPDTFVSYGYLVFGYVGGDWVVSQPGEIPPTLNNTTSISLTPNDLQLQLIEYTSGIGGKGKLEISPVLNLFIPSNMISGNSYTFRAPTFAESIDPGNPLNVGTWTWTLGAPPDIITIDSSDRNNLNFTVTQSGTQTITYVYTSFDGSTVIYSDTENFTTGLPPPVTVNDPGPYQINSGAGGTLDPTTNDNLNSGTLSALVITDYDGIIPSDITINNLTGVLTFATGIAVNTYTLLYTLETENGISNISSINIEVIIIPTSTSDDLNIGSFNNLVGSTAINVFFNDMFAGQTVTDIFYQNYSNAILSGNIAITTGGILTILPDSIPVGSYSFEYAVELSGTPITNYSTVTFILFASPTVGDDFGANSLNISSINTSTFGNDGNIYVRNPKNTIENAVLRYTANYSGGRQPELESLLTSNVNQFLRSGNVISVNGSSLNNFKAFTNYTLTSSSSKQ